VRHHPTKIPSTGGRKSSEKWTHKTICVGDGDAGKRKYVTRFVREECGAMEFEDRVQGAADFISSGPKQEKKSKYSKLKLAQD